MSVHDACSIREKPQVHQAVRNLLKKMNIEVVEKKFNGLRSLTACDLYVVEMIFTQNIQWRKSIKL